LRRPAPAPWSIAATYVKGYPAMDYADTSPAPDDTRAPDTYPTDAWLVDAYSTDAGHVARPFYRADLAFGPDIAPELRADIEFVYWLKEAVRDMTFPVWRLLVYEQAARGTPYADLVILACARLKADMSSQRVAEHVLTGSALGRPRAITGKPRLRLVI